MEYSTLLRREYDFEETVLITNMRQVMLYIKNGLLPVDIMVSDDRLIFAFDKLESRPFYEKWLNHELV